MSTSRRAAAAAATPENPSAYGSTSTRPASTSEAEYIRVLQQQVELLQVECDLLKKARDRQQQQQQQQAATSAPQNITTNQSVDDILNVLRSKFKEQESAYTSKLAELQTKVEELEIEIEARQRVDEEFAAATLLSAKGSTGMTRGVSIPGVESEESELQRLQRELIDAKLAAEKQAEIREAENQAKIQVLRDQLAKQVREIASLKEKLAQQAEIHSSLNDECELLKSAGARDRTELAKLSSEVVSLKTELASRAKHNKELEQRCEALRHEYSQLEQKYSELQRENSNLESHLRTLKLEANSQAPLESADYRERAKESEARAEALARELAVVQDQLRLKSKALEASVNELSILRENQATAESAAQLRVEELEAEVQMLRKQLEKHMSSDERLRLEANYKAVLYERDQWRERAAIQDNEILRLRKELAILDSKVNRSLADTLPAGFSLKRADLPQ